MDTLPLIGYMKSDPEDTSYIDSDNNVRKLWTLVKYTSVKSVDSGEKNAAGYPIMKEVAGDVHTAEFCIYSSSMPDFCGGTHFYSPQVMIYERKGWNATTFCNPGVVPSLGSLDWNVLDEQPDRAVDLDLYTGKDMWTTTELREYGHKCIAAACIGELLARSTVGWVCSDYDGGDMCGIHDLMTNWSDPVALGQPLFVSTVNSSYRGGGAQHSLSLYDIDHIDNGEVNFHNRNSGNDVIIMSGALRTKSKGANYITCEECGFDNPAGCCDECHDCGCYISPDCSSKDTKSLPAQVLACYNNPLFVQQVRRYKWSNG